MRALHHVPIFCLSFVVCCAAGVSAGAVLAPQETSAPADDAAPASAATKATVLSRSYEFEAAKRAVDYALYVPTSYDGETALPLVVLLHGLGSNPGQVIRYQGITAEAERRGYMVVAPFGFNERGWYGSRGHGKEGPFFGNAKDPDNLGELSEQDVFNVLDIVREEFRIDADRIYLMGHSMGGAGTLYLGATRRELWAGLAPLAPAVGGSMDLLANLESVPVFVVAGDRDRLVKVETVRRWVEEMKRIGVACRYEEIAGGDHVRSIAANPELITRVFEFFDGLRRTAKPGDTAQPRDTAKPGDTAQPGDTAKPRDTAKPADSAKPNGEAKPDGPAKAVRKELSSRPVPDRAAPSCR